MDSLLHQYAEKFLNDFLVTIDESTYVKLEIIISDETQPKKIKNFLTHLPAKVCFENLVFSHDNLVNEIDLYQKRDNKKIQRFLQVLDTANEENASFLLIKALNLKSVCKAILTKYPMPSLAGL